MSASSFPGLAIPKPAPRWMDKARQKAEDIKAERQCYRAVDARDGRRCRVCRRQLGGLGMLNAVVHHHLVYRSKTSDPHRSENVITICRTCDDQVHRAGRLRLTGDADLTDERGRFCGVTIERLTESGWAVERLG